LAFYRNERGNVALLTGLMLPCLIGAAALAVDAGMLFLERREAQGAADLAAMAAAADIDNADAAARATLTANGIDRMTAVIVTRGNYKPDPDLPENQRFVPDREPYNAVTVDMTKTGATYFARFFGRDSADIGVHALATAQSQATFSVGSRLLAVRDGLPNAVLGKLTGGSVQLTLMDYEALIAAKVKLQDVLDALATDLDITAGTYDQVLASSANVGDFLDALIAVGENGDNDTATAALRVLKTQIPDLELPLTSVFDLGDLADLTVGAENNPGLDATFNMMELVQSALVAANGDSQVALDLGTAIPGLLSLKADLVIGERPQESGWVKVGAPGATVRTAQTRLRIVAEVGGTGLLAGVRVRLPIYLDLAYAQARLVSITCQDGDAASPVAVIAAMPGVADAWIGEVSAASFPNVDAPATVTNANIVDTALIKVRGQANVNIGDISETRMEFTRSDVDEAVIKRASTSALAQSLVTRLLANLTLDVQVAGLNLGLPGAVKTLVASLLAPVAAPLDAVVFSLLKTLGVSIGEADVRVHGIRCNGAALAG
jgi:uncharacterized membrane protein